MNKQEAIELLKKEDIKTVINEIKEKNLNISYWKKGEDLFNKEDEVINLWRIDYIEMVDWLHFYGKVNLHWTLIAYDIIDKIKEEIEYEIH